MATLILCPYCMTPVQDGEKICPQCAQDMTNDALFEMEPEEYATAVRVACSHCGASFLELAVTCPACKRRQSVA